MSSLMIILRHSIFLHSCQGHTKDDLAPEFWFWFLSQGSYGSVISKKKLNVRSMQQLSWKMMVHGVFTGKGSKSTKYSWHSMKCTLIWGTWNLKIRYIANVISCGFATPRDSAEIDILLKALLVPVWTVTCSYIILCMQQLHQYASLSSQVSVTAFESLLSQLSMAMVKLNPEFVYTIWLYDWSDFHKKNTWIDEIFHDS